MKHVYTSKDLDQAVLIKAVLEKSGIKGMIKNEVLSGGLAWSLGGTNTWPEVWILQDDQLDAAKLLIDDWLKATPVQE